MYNDSKMQSDDAQQADAASAEQSPLALAVQIRKESDHALLNALTALSKVNGLTVVQHDARLAVIGELLVSLLTHLPNAMRSDIAASFRGRIEDLMSLSDD